MHVFENRNMLAFRKYWIKVSFLIFRNQKIRQKRWLPPTKAHHGFVSISMIMEGKKVKTTKLT